MSVACPACGFNDNLFRDQEDWELWLALVTSGGKSADLAIAQLVQRQEAMLARAREHRSKRQRGISTTDTGRADRQAAVALAVQALAPIAGGFQGPDDYNEAVTAFAAGLGDYVQNGT